LKKTLLLFPPQFRPFQPHIALPILTTALRSRGYPVIQRDLNAAAYNAILSTSHLERCYDLVAGQLTATDNLTKDGGLELSSSIDIHELWMKAAYIWPVMVQEVEPAKTVLRKREHFFQLNDYMQAVKKLATLLELVSDAIYPSELSFNHYKSKYSNRCSDGVFQAIEDEDSNLFAPFFRSDVLPLIEAERPDIVGLCFAFPDQLIPGLTLARMIKEIDPTIHIVAGGNIITRLAEPIVKDERFFTLLDSCALYEGENTLPQLVEVLSAGDSLDAIPNLIYRDGDGVHRTPPSIGIATLNLEQLPPPTFDGFPLNQYLSPQPIMPLLTSRDCYFGKCTFCDIPFGYGGGYRQQSPVKIVETMRQISRETGATYFKLVDEAVPPRILRGLAQELVKQGLQYRWEAYARMEKPLADPDLVNLMAAGGCRALYMGLESGSESTLAAMDKKVDLVAVRRILKNMHESGIMTHLFMIIGFPGETREEAQRSIDFVLENIQYVHSIDIYPFMLSRHSRVSTSMSEYPIRPRRVSENEDLALDYAYEVTHGLSHEEAVAMAAEAEREIESAFTPAAQVLRDLLCVHKLLYVGEYGLHDLGALATPNIVKPHAEITI
jgi:anaerobic magnesium-protoporphyrin IX monomethyl ester cyclase